MGYNLAYSAIKPILYAADYFLQFVVICLELRMWITWFPNINPYFEPFLTLWSFTDAITWTNREIYPKFFRVDLTPLINYHILVCLQKFLRNIISFIKVDESHYKNFEEFNNLAITNIDYIFHKTIEILNS